MPSPQQLTPIQTYCPACESKGITAWEDRPGFTIHEGLAALRARCPDCGADGRDATVLDGPPQDPDLAEMWTQMHPYLDAVRPMHRAARTGRNDPCPCGSGRKYKRCCA